MYILVETRYSYRDGESPIENGFQGTSSLCKCLTRHFFQNITITMFFTRAAMTLSGQQWADPVFKHTLPVPVSKSGSPRCAMRGQTSLSCLLSLSWPWHEAAGTLGFLTAGMAPSEATCLLGCDVLSCAERWLCSLCS